MSSKLLLELRRKFKTPQAALRAMGLDSSLIEGPRLASDEAEAADLIRPLMLALKADTTGVRIAADARIASYTQRWPQASRISVEY